MLVLTVNEIEKLFSQVATVPKNTKHAITREKYRYLPPSSWQNYSSYYMPANNYQRKLVVEGFHAEEKQNQCALVRVTEEVSKLQKEIDHISTDEKNLKNEDEELVKEQDKLKEIHKKVLMNITKVRAEIREDIEDTKSLEDILR